MSGLRGGAGGPGPLLHPTAAVRQVRQAVQRSTGVELLPKCCELRGCPSLTRCLPPVPCPQSCLPRCWRRTAASRRRPPWRPPASPPACCPACPACGGAPREWRCSHSAARRPAGASGRLARWCWSQAARGQQRTGPPPSGRALRRQRRIGPSETLGGVGRYKQHMHEAGQLQPAASLHALCRTLQVSPNCLHPPAGRCWCCSTPMQVPAGGTACGSEWPRCSRQQASG